MDSQQYINTQTRTGTRRKIRQGGKEEQEQGEQEEQEQGEQEQEQQMYDTCTMITRRYNMVCNQMSKNGFTEIVQNTIAGIDIKIH